MIPLGMLHLAFLNLPFYYSVIFVTVALARRGAPVTEFRIRAVEQKP